jgi:excisionase family DNA binding protein
MAPMLLTRSTVIVDEALKGSAIKALDSVDDEKLVELTLTTSTGRKIMLDAALAELVGHVLSRVAQGGQVTVQSVPDVLTTSAAADLLGVTRPTVMKLIQKGELDAVMAGTHHRLRFSDVAALQYKREQARRSAIEELLRLGEDDE